MSMKPLYHKVEYGYGVIGMDRADPNQMAARADVPAPGTKPAGAVEADTRFDAEPVYEQTADTTWGYCLYEGKAAVVSCATSLEELEVPAFLGGCPVTFIAPRAFSNMAELHEVVLPGGLEEVCDFAFMFSGLRSFTAPSGLKAIGARAFYNCTHLHEAALNEGLEVIGREAFALTKVARLTLPASVREVGWNALSKCEIAFGSGNRTLEIAKGSPFFLDDVGCMYERAEEGLILRAMLDKDAESYEVQPGTTVIASRAFNGCTELVSVGLPEGLNVIDEAAFAGCTRLESVDLPSSLVMIGASAFKNCVIKAVHLPQGLSFVGVDAFATTMRGIYVRPLIRSITVEEGNETFYVVSGMLILRGEGPRNDAVLLYFGPGGTVEIPEEVSVIGPSAFAGQTVVRRLVLHDHVSRVESQGFFFEGGLTEIVFRNAAPDGSDATVLFPRSSGGISGVRSSFRKGFIDAETAMGYADAAILGAVNRQERYELMSERLANPLWLGEDMRQQYARSLKQSIGTVCAVFAQANFLQGYETLADVGVLDAVNFDTAMTAVADTGEVVAVNIMLELKRRKFSGSEFDFDL